jgi:hypothetical protein
MLHEQHTIAISREAVLVLKLFSSGASFLEQQRKETLRHRELRSENGFAMLHHRGSSL